MNYVRSHQITGVGPVDADGNRQVYTILPNPFLATAAMINALGKDPEVGDNVLEAADGSIALESPTVDEPVPHQATSQLADGTPVPDGAGGAVPTEKKNGGSGSTDGSSEAVAYRSTYQVKAYPVTAVSGDKNENGTYNVTAADGRVFEAGEGETVKVGDYVVEHNDSPDHMFVNKDEFEANFAPV